MFCTNCGKQNQEGCKFCKNCGSEFSDHATVAETNKPVEQAVNLPSQPPISDVQQTKSLPTKIVTDITYNDLLTVADIENPHQNDSVYPLFIGEWQLQLAEGEKVVWQGNINTVEHHTIVGGVSKVMWKLPSTYIFITNHRIVYACRKFNKGKTWWGFGTGGILLAGALTIGSHAMAAYQRHGKAAVGQIRHQWSKALLHEIIKQDWGSDFVMLQIVYGNNVRSLIKMYIPKEESERIAYASVEQIAKFSLDQMIKNHKPVPGEDLSADKVEKISSDYIKRLTSIRSSEDKGTSVLNIYTF